jgi:hypothetical protein
LRESALEDDVGMNQNVFFAGLMLVCGCVAQSKAPPLACNLRAFSTTERADWRKRLGQLKLSVSAVRELSEGYSFQIDPHRTSFLEVAQWIDLERKCCPFLVFELALDDAGTIQLNLRGREGVKQFIAWDFQPLFSRLAGHSPDRQR